VTCTAASGLDSQLIIRHPCFKKNRAVMRLVQKPRGNALRFPSAAKPWRALPVRSPKKNLKIFSGKNL
jgi:hypothetical protein